jgi:isopentenyldiphosphate isomerase
MEASNAWKQLTQFIHPIQVWTNTCCSHPLHGMEPSEVDVSCADGKVLGVKNAAIRKLDHELGIPPCELDSTKFQVLTRLQYWAADPVTHGKTRYVVVVDVVVVVALESINNLKVHHTHSLLSFFYTPQTPPSSSTYLSI